MKPTVTSDWLTPHIVFVCAIQLFDPSVAEGQFPHPVDAAADTRSQAQVGASCSCMEAISCKTVSTVNNNDMFYLKNLLWQNKENQMVMVRYLFSCTQQVLLYTYLLNWMQLDTCSSLCKTSSGKWLTLNPGHCRLMIRHQYVPDHIPVKMKKLLVTAGFLLRC